MILSGKRAPEFGYTEEQAELVCSKPVVSTALVSTYGTFSFPAAQLFKLVSATMTVVSP